MIEVPAYFKIDQDAGGTAVDEISAEEYAKRCAVMVMEQALQRRREIFSFPKGNLIEKIMETFIHERIPVDSVERILVSDMSLGSLLSFRGLELSWDASKQFWIFDGIVPVDISDEITTEFEIVRKDR